MDPLSVLALATQCVTAAPAPLVAAVALVETDAAPYAVTVAGKRSMPTTIEEAVQTVALALTSEAPIRVGIAGVPVSAFEDRDLSYTDGFSPCRNLSVAGELLSESWQHFGGMREHWRLAVLEYGTGDAGTQSDYAAHFDAALAQVHEVAGQHPFRKVVADATQSTSSVQPIARAAKDSTANRSGWDVFGRDRSRSLLIYSK